MKCPPSCDKDPAGDLCVISVFESEAVSQLVGCVVFYVVIELLMMVLIRHFGFISHFKSSSSVGQRI